ncbi:hypothetical protein [Natronococcus roseus]|uniref:hypothetical protein n=1 Tax=Natronococcus roseus TaxID=1052014 RepID=UPI00374D54BC
MAETQPINCTKTDPRVSCPIVCGEYMRASGFFFDGNKETYLVTARHNVLPTNGGALKTNEYNLPFVALDYLPTIHVYLRTSSGFEVKHLDIRERTGVKQTAEIDIIAVPIYFDPEEYGYQVWNSDDVAAPEHSSESVDIIGFNGECFPDPDREYEVETYRNAIRNPAMHRLANEMPEDNDPFRYGLTAIAIDDNPVVQIDGLSGAPVLGNQLLGIQAATVPVPEWNIKQAGDNDFRVIVYWRAGILPKLCG